ncbi:sensor histidine kinase [Microbacterium sp. NPDC091382]|uniref:sensor histidine kinase n=1 Tax=Microbacterium sp. NPDC091382 TaxID=3364210 RepID=UPI00382C1EE8
MTRPRGLSARVTLTLSYVGLVLVAGALILTVVWLFLLRYVPDEPLFTGTGFAPSQRDLLRAFAGPAGAVMVALLFLGAVGGWFLAGRMLAPLDALTEATRRADAGDLSTRVRMAGRQDEFRELADSFDGMLQRIESHVGEQRRFAANASHELRTPLAITRTLLDVARSDPDRDVDDLLSRLAAVNERGVELVEGLLLLARADRGGFPQASVDLSLLAEDAAETLLPLAEARGVELVVRGDEAAAFGSSSLLGQVALNLLQNALIHGDATEPVTVTTHRDGGAAILIVENGGDRLDPAVVSTLAEPFQRGAARIRRSDHERNGLGLAIVTAIVGAHGGELTLAARSAGGLRATVRLPAHGS